MAEVISSVKCETEKDGSSLNNENESIENQENPCLSMKSEVVDETSLKIESHELSSVNPLLDAKELINQLDASEAPSPGNVVLSKRAQKRLEKKKAWDAGKPERR